MGAHDALGHSGRRFVQDPLRLGKKKTTVVDAEKKPEEVYGKKYRINRDHQILEVNLAPASQMVKGPHTTKLKYKLTNIELEYEMIRSKQLPEEATSAYTNGKEFLYDHVNRFIVRPIDKTRPLITSKSNHKEDL